jgi:hypothetical protein
LCPQPNPFALSLALRARPESSATAHHRLSTVLRPSSSPRPVYCLGEFRLIVSYSGHPLVCPSPLWFARSALTGVFLAQPEPRRRGPEAPSHPRRSPSVPEFALKVSTLPMPLFRQVSRSRSHPRHCSSELVAPLRDFSHRGLRSLAPPCRFCAHGRVRRVALNVFEPFPKPLEPRRGCPLVSGEPSPRDRVAPSRSGPAPGCWILGVRPRSGGLDFSRTDLIPALRSRSDRPSLSPSPVPLPQPALAR